MSVTAELVDLAGVRRGDLAFRSMQVKPMINGPVAVTFTIDNRGPAASEVNALSRGVRIFQDGTCRFKGRICDPLQRKPRELNVTCSSPLGLYNRRQLQEEKASVTPVDAGEVVLESLADENLRSPTGMVIGTVQPSVSHPYDYQAGTDLLSIVTGLANGVDGFFFRETFPDDIPSVFSKLQILYPTAGIDRACRFQYGDGTMANLDDYTVTEGLPVNGVSATGSSLTSRAENAASIAAYGLFEVQASFSDVTMQTVLDQQAQGVLYPSGTKTYQVMPGAGSNTPAFYDDFDVGDTVLLTVHDGSTWFDDVRVRVNDATLSVSDGSEVTLVTAMTLEVVP